MDSFVGDVRDAAGCGHMVLVGVNKPTYDVTTIVIVSYKFLMYRSGCDDVTLPMVMLTALIVFRVAVGSRSDSRHRYADLAGED